MKSTKQLQALYEAAKGDKQYYSFEDFMRNAKTFIQDVKKHQTVCSMRVSKSGMTRHFNFQRHNMLLNILYNKKMSWEAVKVGGCGMDMHWHLKYRACEDLCTRREVEKYHLNAACSGGSVL